MYARYKCYVRWVQISPSSSNLLDDPFEIVGL